jgi:23S rRNA-/tRNA-specific pseudouridylate synthase
MASVAVVYEDADLAVVIKPVGMTTMTQKQPGGLVVPNLKSILPHILQPCTGAGALTYPHPVHRLDKVK